MITKILFFLFIPLMGFCISGKFVFNEKNLRAGEEFQVLIEITFSSDKPVVLKGAPKLKVPDSFTSGKVSSFSRSGSEEDKIYYKYTFLSKDVGDFVLGPAIITYFTKSDPDKNKDEDLSLAEITDKAVEGEKVVDTHSFVVNEIDIKIRTYNYFLIAMYFISAIALMCLVLLLFLKIKKNRTNLIKHSNKNDDYLKMLIKIKKLFSEGEVNLMYSEMVKLGDKTGFSKTKILNEKLENIKFASYNPDQGEIEKDLRSLEVYVKTQEGGN